MGGERESQERWRRPLLVLVGPDDASRFRVVQQLIDRENAVVVCNGPPGCPLARGEDCSLVAAADAVVVLPGESSNREVAISLTMCARRSGRAVVVDPTLVRCDGEVLHVDSAEAAVLAVPALFHRTHQTALE